MRQHMGFHIMHEPSKITAKYPCGFCVGEIAQFLPDVSQLTGCAVWLDPKGQPKCIASSWGRQVQHRQCSEMRLELTVH